MSFRDNGTIISSSERRHRLQPEEVPEVVEGLRLRLRHHLEARENMAMAAVAFRTFYRLVTHQVGRPDYPEPVTWDLIEHWLNGTISRAETSREVPELGDEEDP